MRVYALLALPKVSQVFHLHPPRNVLGSETFSCSLLAIYLECLPQWHTKLVTTSGTSQLLFFAWNFFPFEFAWLLPSPEWRVNSNVTSEVSSLTTSSKVSILLTPAPIIVFQTLVYYLLVCLFSIAFAPNQNLSSVKARTCLPVYLLLNLVYSKLLKLLHVILASNFTTLRIQWG